MLNDLWNIILQSIEFLWPAHIVSQWDESLHLRFGKRKRKVGPGGYFKIPWVDHYHDVSVAEWPVETGRLDLTTKDGRMLHCSAIAMTKVVDVDVASIKLHDYEHSASRLLGSALASALAGVDPERFAPEKRKGLGRTLDREVQEAFAPYGMHVESVDFTTFVLNPKTFLLLGDQRTP